MNRLAPLLVLVSVTVLFFAYGGHPWSWVAGPVAALLVWSLDRKAREPIVVSGPAQVRRAPAPVD